MAHETEDTITYVFRWITVHDERVCPKCAAFHGKEWRDQDLFTAELYDDIYGPAWNFDANHSLLHPNCRCQLEVTVEVHLEQIEVYSFTMGKPVSVARTARFTLLSADISALRDAISNLKVDLDEAKTSVIEINRLLTTYVSLSRRMGLPTDAVELIAVFQRMRLIVQTLTQAIMTFYTTAGPIGWAIGLGGILVSGFMVADMASIRRPTY